MDNPVQTPNHGQNPGKNIDIQDIVLYFGSIRVGKDGNSGKEDASSQINNASSSISIMKKSAANDESSNKFNNQADVAQDTYVKTQCMSENSFSHRGSIWGHRFFLTEGDGFSSNPHDHGQESFRDTKYYKDCHVDLSKPEHFDAENSGGQPRMDSFCCYPSISNCVSQLESNPLFCEDSGVRPPALYDYRNDHYWEMKNGVLHYSNDYGTPNNDLTSGCQRIHQELNTFPQTTPLFDLTLFHKTLDGGDYQQIEKLILIFQGSYIFLMTDKRMFVVFQKLVDACRCEHLSFLVEEVLSCSQSFINAAFCKPGASSITRLIKKLKKSSLAFSVTKVLSTQFLDIMTHDVARVVIQHCFISFGNQPNKILYEQAIYHFQELAIHKVGCRALNEMINTIADEQRSKLLNHIANFAAYLSNDPYGNYVVQNVLSLTNQDVSTRIVLSLQGHFVQLARKAGGSHVVEKCMDASDFGVVTVVQEILDTPKEPFRLAQDNFGNYVIQKALKKTKEHGLFDLYDSLKKSLQPYYGALNQTAGGKSVLNLLKDGSQLQWQTSTCGKDSAMRWWELLC